MPASRQTRRNSQTTPNTPIPADVIADAVAELTTTAQENTNMNAPTNTETTNLPTDEQLLSVHPESITDEPTMKRALALAIAHRNAQTTPGRKAVAFKRVQALEFECDVNGWDYTPSVKASPSKVDYTTMTDDQLRTVHAAKVTIRKDGKPAERAQALIALKKIEPIMSTRGLDFVSAIPTNTGPISRDDEELLTRIHKLRQMIARTDDEAKLKTANAKLATLVETAAERHLTVSDGVVSEPTEVDADRIERTGDRAPKPRHGRSAPTR